MPARRKFSHYLGACIGHQSDTNCGSATSGSHRSLRECARPRDRLPVRVSPVTTVLLRACPSRGAVFRVTGKARAQPFPKPAAPPPYFLGDLRTWPTAAPAATRPAKSPQRGHVTMEACQVSGFVQRTAANPARSGRKQR